MSVVTVTMEGMVPSQPGVCVSTQSPGWNGHPVVLSVFRAYNDLPNSWGGKGKHKHCDGHNRVFNTQEEATRFCVERGYLRPFRPNMRARRKAEARDPRQPRK